AQNVMESEIIQCQLLTSAPFLLMCHQDAESRHEQQINKLVLEKQELEWNKESLQSKIETMTSQHSEAVASVKNKMFLNVLSNLKGKYQLAAELNNKGVNSLKEELKLLRVRLFFFFYSCLNKPQISIVLIQNLLWI
uniref:Uncharacterized protein n=1 Tax=Denticeps clupeoides TaxID=299321 RepID=A0AAY4DPB9_9TELE